MGRSDAERFRLASNASPSGPTAAEQSTGSRPEKTDDSWAVRIRRLLLEDPPPPQIVVAEELAPHVVVEDVPPAVVSEINGHADRYPGVKIVELTRRTYPPAHWPPTCSDIWPTGKAGTGGRTAPGRQNVGPADRLVGRMGVERQYEAALAARPGVAVEQTDPAAASSRPIVAEEPVAGEDVELTLDVALQRTAEELLKAPWNVDRLPPGKGSEHFPDTKF